MLATTDASCHRVARRATRRLRTVGIAACMAVHGVAAAAQAPSGATCTELRVPPVQDSTGLVPDHAVFETVQRLVWRFERTDQAPDLVVSSPESLGTARRELQAVLQRPGGPHQVAVAFASVIQGTYSASTSVDASVSAVLYRGLELPTAAARLVFRDRHTPADRRLSAFVALGDSLTADWLPGDAALVLCDLGAVAAGRGHGWSIPASPRLPTVLDDAESRLATEVAYRLLDNPGAGSAFDQVLLALGGENAVALFIRDLRLQWGR